MSCPEVETWAAWVLGESGQRDAELESHLFECAECARRAQGVERLVRELRTMPPMLVTAERRLRLEAELGSAALAVVAVGPGERATIELGPKKPVGLWVMRADLAGAERIDCELLTLEGEPFATFTDVPFDAGRGEVVLCCQVHYRDLGEPEMRARLSAVEAGQTRAIAEYRLNHEFVV